MPRDADPFRDLLDRWEELHESGQEPDVGELCRDCPQYTEQLRDWVRMLKMSEWLTQPADVAAAETWSGADRLAAVDREQIRTLGEYQLIEELGGGGMGRVFRAVHRKLRREFALKVLPPTAWKSRESVQRFQREIDVLAKLSHPNIVAVHDAGEANGTLYFVMELIPGKDLYRLVQENGALPVDRAIDCLVQTATGLAYSHVAGIVHRDIKPSNLMLDAQNNIRILDLGIARVVEKDDVPADFTRTGSILGTVDYMAPEQALSTRKADQRADIYSLGCTLFYLLTGKAVYGGESVMERLVAHRESRQPSLREACPAAPDWLDRLFHQMIAKRPEDRVQTMAEVVSALRDQAAPQQARRRWIAVYVGLIVLTLVTTCIFFKSSASKSIVTPAWRMVSNIPQVAGIWKQWDGIVLDISQHGDQITADCRYGQPDVTVHWRADGTISPEGKIIAQLVHTDPPRAEPAKPQICTAQLQPDGQTIRGHAAWTNGGDDFTWRLQDPKTAEQERR